MYNGHLCIDIDDSAGDDGNHGGDENNDKLISEKLVSDTLPIYF